MTYFFDIGGPDQVMKVRSRLRSAKDQMLYQYAVLLLCVCLSERTNLGADISKMVGDREVRSNEHQQQIAYGESHGHVFDDVT